MVGILDFQGDVVGSGTILEGGYVLTTYHVTTTKDAIDIAVWPWKGSKRGEYETVKAALVKYDKANDLSLYRLAKDTVYHAILADREPEIFEDVFAVGAALGSPPFPKEGLVSSLDIIVWDVRKMLFTAPVAAGDSGGAVFVYDKAQRRYELVGVIVAIRNQPHRRTGAPANHVALASPMDIIHKFLDSTEVAFNY